MTATLRGSTLRPYSSLWAAGAAGAPARPPALPGGPPGRPPNAAPATTAIRARQMTNRQECVLMQFVPFTFESCTQAHFILAVRLKPRVQLRPGRGKPGWVSYDSSNMLSSAAFSFHPEPRSREAVRLAY